VLSLGKEAVTIIVASVNEHKTKVESSQKIVFEEKLSELSKHFNRRTEELGKIMDEMKGSSNSGRVQLESELNQRFEKIAESAQSKLEETTSTNEMELVKQSQGSLASWEERAADLCASATREMGVEIENVKTHRKESLRKLQDKLNKLSDKVKGLQKELVLESQ
jgi:hypothetical protein